MSSSAATSTYSPWDCLPAAPLTASGLLQTEPNEVTLITRASVELRSGAEEPMTPLDAATGLPRNAGGKQWVDRCRNLQLIITTHRIVFMQQPSQPSSRQQARFLHFSHVVSCQAETVLFKSPKMLLKSQGLGDLRLVFGSSSDRDDCLAVAEKSLTRQEWDAAQRQQDQAKLQQRVATKRKVGVDAVLTSHNFRRQQADKLAQTAFEGDAETLLKEAGPLIQVIHKYVATLDRQKEGTGGDGDDDNNTRQLVDMLQDMGLTSALTKEDYKNSSSNLYYDQLARQVADFCRPRLVKAGGYMTLTDVYCLYNRARASNLISPEDLLEAVACLDKLNLGICSRSFESGLVVLQDVQVDDAKSAARLVAMCGQQGLTAEVAAQHLNLSTVLLAHEQLLVAEQLGVLVRDETLESLRFFPNRFEEFSNMAW